MPQLSDIEDIHVQLLDVGNEARISAQWNEKIESFDSLQNKALVTPLEQSKEKSLSTSSKDDAQKQSQLSKILQDIDVSTLNLDTLPESPASTDSVEQAAEDETEQDLAPEYDEYLLSQALSALSPDLKDKIVRILADPHIESDFVSTLIDDLIANKPVRRIVSTVKKIMARHNFTDNVGDISSHNTRFNESTARLGVRAVCVSIIILLLFMGTWRFVYRPISAHILYLRAISSIENNQPDIGEVLFDRAQEYHRFKYQLLDIATAFQEQREYDLADRYYQRYTTAYPNDIEGIVQYVSFLSEDLANIPRAITFATEKFNEENTSRTLVELLGDLHIVHGDAQTDAGYDSARYYYATVIDTYGLDILSISNMVRFFIRTNNIIKINEILAYFMADDYRKIRPIVLSELIEYLVTHMRVEELADIVQEIEPTDIKDAGVHFQLAGYFLAIENRRGALESLRNAEAFFRTQPPRTRYETEILIRIYGMRAQLAMERADVNRALPLYNQAISRFEAAHQNNLVSSIFTASAPSAAAIAPNTEFVASSSSAGSYVSSAASFGALYAGRAALYYRINSAYDIALQDYARAQEHLYYSPKMDYVIGNIHYQRAQYDRAMQSFERILNKPHRRINGISSQDKNTLYAMGNSLFLLSGYAAALGHYRELTGILEKEYLNAPPFIPKEDYINRETREMLIATYNNMGVSYAKLHQVQSDQGHIQKSIFYLQRAHEEYVEYRRISEVDIVAHTLSLPYRNNFTQLHGAAEQLQIYAVLPSELSDYFVNLIDRNATESSTLSDPRVRHTEFL